MASTISAPGDAYSSSTFAQSNARIFVVDDDPSILLLVETMLRKAGYSALELISDPREVLSRFLKKRPDLVLLDLNMPHMNGYEVMSELKALNEPVPTPIVMLTAEDGDDFMVQALDMGARDYISKPIRSQVLTTRVQNLLSTYFAHRMSHDHAANLEHMVRQRTQALNRSRLEVVRRLGRAAEYRDNETGLHTIRMSRYASLLSRSLGWSETDTELMLYASPLHDVGKIGIPDGILLKPGSLNDHEREIMKRHASIGAEILSDSDCEILQLARTIALGHHEKWDGSGYPLGLAGADIPQAARIVAVADVFDALTSRRPYKAAWSIDDAVAYLQVQAGKHFDPEVVEHFIRLLPEIQVIRQEHCDPEDFPRFWTAPCFEPDR